jgi:hypothetical protein
MVAASGACNLLLGPRHGSPRRWTARAEATLFAKGSIETNRGEGVGKTFWEEEKERVVGKLITYVSGRETNLYNHIII